MKMRPQMRKDVFRAAEFKNFKDTRYISRMFWLGVDAYENARKTMSFSHGEGCVMANHLSDRTAV